MLSIARFSGNSIRAGGMFLEKNKILPCSEVFTKIDKMWWEQKSSYRTKEKNPSEVNHRCYFIRNNYQEIIFMNWGVTTDVTLDFTNSSIVLSNIVDIIFGAEQNIIFILLNDGSVYGMGDIIELTFKTGFETINEKSIMKMLFDYETNHITTPRKITQLSNIKKMTGSGLLTFMFHTHDDKFYAIGDYLGKIVDGLNKTQNYLFKTSSTKSVKKPILTSTDPTSSPFPLYYEWGLGLTQVFNNALSNNGIVTDARIANRGTYFVIINYNYSYYDSVEKKKMYVDYVGLQKNNFGGNGVTLKSTTFTSQINITKYYFAAELDENTTFATESKSLWVCNSCYSGSFIKTNSSNSSFTLIGLSYAGLLYASNLTGSSAPIINGASSLGAVYKIIDFNGNWIFLTSKNEVYIDGTFLDPKGNKFNTNTTKTYTKFNNLRYSNGNIVNDIVDIFTVNNSVVLLRKDGYMYMIGYNGVKYGELIKNPYPFKTIIGPTPLNEFNQGFEEYLIRIDSKQI